MRAILHPNERTVQLPCFLLLYQSQIIEKWQAFRGRNENRGPFKASLDVVSHN